MRALVKSVGYIHALIRGSSETNQLSKVIKLGMLTAKSSDNLHLYFS
jgi:hypothetical protein